MSDNDGMLRQKRYLPYRCGMCEEEFYVLVVNDVPNHDTQCPNCGSDETERDDLPACMPASRHRA